MDLICQDIHFGLGEKKILKGISLKVEGHQFHTILGPNGSGKTSLLKLLYRQEKADKGLISLDGKSLEHWSLKETAKQMAVVTQFNQLQFDCTVEEIVLLGRTPHLSFLQKERERDFTLVQDALVKVDMLEKKTRLYSSLSGGEKQRVLENSSLFVSVRGGETTSLISPRLGARTDSLAPGRTNQSPGYQVSARLVGHCEESQGQCFSCPT